LVGVTIVSNALPLATVLLSTGRGTSIRLCLLSGTQYFAEAPWHHRSDSLEGTGADSHVDNPREPGRLAQHIRSIARREGTDAMILLSNILVATDFGPAADAALRYGRALAQTFRARLHVLHVIDNSFFRATPADPYAHKEAVLRRLQDLLTADDRTTLKAHAILETSDSAAEAIAAFAKSANIDLVVLGTNGRGTVAQLLVGSVAERVVRIAPCPVLTVRHPEHEFVLPDVMASVTDSAR